MKLRLRRMFKGIVIWSMAAGLTLGAAQGTNELVIAQGVDVPGFDTQAQVLAAAEAVYVNIFDYLVMTDHEGALQPALATSWEQVGPTSMRFDLRDNVRWHDGTLFTAADVKFTLERVATDSSLEQHENFSQISGVEVVNDFQVIIHTNGPDPLLLNRVSKSGSLILPKAYIESVGWEVATVQPIGTGPFRFVEWRRDDRIVMEAFDDHWRGRPVWDRLVHRTIPEDTTRVNEVITGGVHIATNVPAQEVDRIGSSGVAQVLPWTTPRIMMVVFNTHEDAATGDPRVREAIDLAIDDQLLVDAVMGGWGTPVQGRVSPGITAAPMDLYDSYRFDPERARALLAEAGYAEGELRITFQGPAGRYPNDTDIAEVIAVMLEQVGIKVELQTLEWTAFSSQVWNTSNMKHLALIALGNPMFDSWYALRALTCSGSYQPMVGWCNERFDELLSASTVETDLGARAELLREAFYIVDEERPWITLFQLENLVAVDSKIAWEPRPNETLWMFDAVPRD